MRSLTPLAFNAREFNKSIYYINETPLRVKAGQEKIHDNIGVINNRFAEYDTKKDCLENIIDSNFTKAFDEELYDSLFNLYDSKESLKSEIRKISGVKCPYCSINESPFHVDHFLPRSKFPEFSIYTYNLIAVCASCNSRYKGDDFVDSNGNRLFFNPYFDSFINQLQLLKCLIRIDNIYPKFEFYIDDRMIVEHSYEYKIIKNHFDNLNLQNRYMEQIVEEVFLRFVKRYIDKQTKVFKDITLDKLKEDIDSELNAVADFNHNNWEKVFWESLKESDDCLNLIVNKLIPIN